MTLLPHTRLSLLLLLVGSPALLAGCGEAAGECDAELLRERLATAAPGDVVTAGACTLVGPFTVPEGVELRGAGDATVLVAPPSGVAVTLTPSGVASRVSLLSGLSIESVDGCAGISATGAGVLAVIDVSVRAETGVGIAIEGATEAQLSNVDVTGPITADTLDTTVAPLPPFRCGSGDLATHGVVLVDVGRAQVTNASTIAGFGRFGLLSVRSALEASGLAVRHNLGAGIEIWDGSASLDGVTVASTGDGLGAIEAFGLVVAGGGTAVSTDLEVSGGDGHGVFHDSASATHTNLTVIDNGFAGLWAQSATDLSVMGESRIERNAFAGAAVFDSTGVSLHATIADTAFGVAVSRLATVRGADGVHSVASGITLTGVVLRDNARVGAVLDLDGGITTDVTLTDVTVEASGMALGAVAQNGMVVDGWDDSVTRLGATSANDSAFTGALEIAEGIGPPCLPPLDTVEAGGISDLIAP